MIVQMALGVLTVSAAEEHELSNPQVPSGQRNRERGRGSVGWGVHCRGVRFASKQEADSRFRLEVRFSFFIQFLQINFKVSDKAEEERTCIVVSGKKCHKRTYLGMTREEDTRTGFQIKRFC